MTSAFFCFTGAATGIQWQQKAKTVLWFGIFALNKKKKRGEQTFFQPKIQCTSVPEQREGLNTRKRWLVNLVLF